MIVTEIEFPQLLLLLILVILFVCFFELMEVCVYLMRLVLGSVTRTTQKLKHGILCHGKSGVPRTREVDALVSIHIKT